MISSSMVRQEPPAFTILARALSVKRRAATSSLGRSRTRASSVTVPTTTAGLALRTHGQTRLSTYVLEPRCLTSLERDTGGLIVREATSLLRIVLQNFESVLLDKNLKSCRTQDGVSGSAVTYPDEQVLIKILAFRVLLGLVLNSASFNQVNSLPTQTTLAADQTASSPRVRATRHPTPHLPFFLVLFILNNKSQPRLPFLLQTLPLAARCASIASWKASMSTATPRSAATWRARLSSEQGLCRLVCWLTV